VFDGSTSLFETQRVLCASIGHAIWLTQFTHVRHDHLHFVQALFQAFCSLGICCAFTGQYPAYIAGVLDKYCLEDDFCICHLYIAKSISTILGPSSKDPLNLQWVPLTFNSDPERPLNIMQIIRPTTFRMRT